MTHTPGPWKIETDGTQKIIVNEAGSNVAKINYRWNKVAENANATLIKETPNLLAACEASLAWLEDFVESAHSSFGGETELAHKLMDAIAAATLKDEHS